MLALPVWPFLYHILKALVFLKIALKLKYFCKKRKISGASGSVPRSQCPPAAGGSPLDPQDSPPLLISSYVPAQCHVLQ